MKLIKPYNSYNLFFILERARILEEKKAGSIASSAKMMVRFSASQAVATGYEFLDIPPLPPRYRHLEKTLAANWYDPGRNKLAKRKHGKSHGGECALSQSGAYSVHIR